MTSFFVEVVAEAQALRREMRVRYPYFLEW
jgi:hypothetical protein